MVRTALTFVIALLLAGCGTFKGYPGPERRSDEISVITASFWQGYWVVGAASFTFTSLDGIPITAPTTEVHVEPGEHQVDFTLSVAYACGYFGCAEKKYSGSLSFTALKGNRYIFDADRSHGRLWAWIVDDKSGQIIAGERPPEERDEALTPE